MPAKHAEAMADDNLDILETEYPLVTFDNRTSGGKVE